MIFPTGPTAAAILTGSAAMTAFKGIHPLIIEGMGAYDPRDPSRVASRLASALKPRLDARIDGTKPVLLITQGDPLAERGISAITRALATELNVQRGLVVLDPEVADYHTRDADRENTVLELKYSELLEYVDEERIEAAVDEALGRKNNDRLGRGEKELASYYKDFAMLQEVTKAASKTLTGEITIAHTQLKEEISEFSVTSFYKVGLDLELYKEEDFV
ncbi:hypothetical protein TrVE_jg8442 [Triparma verrucosa]|uniref:Uncharacterized protein n=1 Tax=Triparma verrucosa TaxID=1606542 RepID=A0A9W7C2M9_9STRA|nr:hypothetical protein TrVE_jg8442 [Triparma verrucosa]